MVSFPDAFSEHDAALNALSPLREVIARHEIAAKKNLGQNFIFDLNLTGRVARAAGDLSGCDVLEIGPGPGGLTRALLLAGARKVVAIERDARALPALAEIQAAAPERLEVVDGDALKFDPAPHLTAPVKIVANLPYNIGTELLIRWLTAPVWPPFWASLTLMFQKEVAERIVAGPGDSAYGRLGVLAGWRTQADIAFEIPPSAFFPPPKVTSAVVRLRPRPQPLAEAELPALERVTAAAFGQRRKMLRQSLRSLGVEPIPLLEAAGIDPQRRAETLSVQEFCALARGLKAAES